MKYLLLLILASCANIKTIDQVKNFNHVVNPGRVTFIEIPTDEKKLGDLKCGKDLIQYYSKKNSIAFYFAESYWSTEKNKTCKFSKNSNLIISLKIEKYKYPSEMLHVDKKRVFLSKEDQKRAAKEREITSRVYKNFLKEPQFTGAFIEPLNSHKTSIYGTKRIFNNKKHSTHLGTDYRARTPIKIPSANRGVVVLAENLFYAGNAVIVDHGANIFTMYGHLSKILVKVGDVVEKGTVIGMSGATGRVSGPHLHWGVKVQGENISGVSLVEASTREFSK